ncbi:uncharacterized protein LOC114676843 [Macaca mulatta]
MVAAVPWAAAAGRRLSLRVPGSPRLARSRLARGGGGTSAPSAPPPRPRSAGELASLPAAALALLRAPASAAAWGCLGNRARHSSAPETLPARNSRPPGARRRRARAAVSHTASLRRGPRLHPLS